MMGRRCRWKAVPPSCTSTTWSTKSRSHTALPQVAQTIGESGWTQTSPHGLSSAVQSGSSAPSWHVDQRIRPWWRCQFKNIPVKGKRHVKKMRCTLVSHAPTQEGMQMYVTAAAPATARQQRALQRFHAGVLLSRLSAAYGKNYCFAFKADFMSTEKIYLLKVF